MNSEELHFSRQDYSALMFDVSKVPQESSVSNFFPQLKKCPEFSLHLLVNLSVDDKKPEVRELNKNRVLRYIIFLYDRNSKLNVMKDPKQMRVQAALEAGFTVNDKGKFTPEVELMLQGRVKNINLMAIRFARFFYNITYSQLVTIVHALYRTEAAFVTERDEEVKAKVYKTMIAMGENVEQMASKLLMNDTNPWLAQDLFSLVENDIEQELMLSPERMAMGGDE